MNIKNRETPFWAFRYQSKSGRTLFSIYRIVEASKYGIKADKRVGTLYFGPAKIQDTKDEFSYSNFSRNFRCISKLSEYYKREFLISILEKYK